MKITSKSTTASNAEMCTPCPPKICLRLVNNTFKVVLPSKTNMTLMDNKKNTDRRTNNNRSQAISPNYNNLVFTSKDALDPCLHPITDPCDSFHLFCSFKYHILYSIEKNAPLYYRGELKEEEKD